MCERCIRVMVYDYGNTKLQTYFPLTTNFCPSTVLRIVVLQYVGDVTMKGRLCTKWTYKHRMFDRNNKYAFYATKTDPPIPVRYEMNGYDTLLVSYYDRYVVDYHSFEEWNYDDEKFKVPHRKMV